MFGIPDYGAFCAAILLFLALPGPGTFALLTSTGKGGLRGGAAATWGLIVGDQILLWAAVAGVAAVLAAHPMAFKAIQVAGAAYLAWVGFKLIFVSAPEAEAGPAHPSRGSVKLAAAWRFLVRQGQSANPVNITPGHYARQALVITLLNPKAIVFYMAFFPLFIDPAHHRGMVTFAAMALTIALITAAYCAMLCLFADALASKVRSHQRLTLWLQRVAGLFLVGFGLRLVKD